MSNYTTVVQDGSSPRAWLFWCKRCCGHMYVPQPKERRVFIYPYCPYCRRKIIGIEEQK